MDHFWSLGICSMYHVILWKSCMILQSIHKFPTVILSWGNTYLPIGQFCWGGGGEVSFCPDIEFWYQLAQIFINLGNVIYQSFLLELGGHIPPWSPASYAYVPAWLLWIVDTSFREKAIRIIINSNYYPFTKRLFFDLNTLTTFDVYHKYQVTIFMYKYANSVVHNVWQLAYLNWTEITITFPLYSRFTTQAFNCSLYVMGPTFWNNLNVSIKNSKLIGIFCKHLKDYILQGYNV